MKPCEQKKKKKPTHCGQVLPYSNQPLSVVWVDQNSCFCFGVCKVSCAILSLCGMKTLYYIYQDAITARGMPCTMKGVTLVFVTLLTFLYFAIRALSVVLMSWIILFVSKVFFPVPAELSFIFNMQWSRGNVDLFVLKYTCRIVNKLAINRTVVDWCI